MYSPMILASIIYEGKIAYVVEYFFTSAKPLNPVFTNRTGTPRLAGLTEEATALTFAVPKGASRAMTLSFKMSSFVRATASVGT